LTSEVGEDTTPSVDVSDSVQATAPTAATTVQDAHSGDAPRLPIFTILDSIDFADHFVIIGDVGTGKSTVTPVHEFELSGRSRQIFIREPSRASCSALFYSLEALHPEIRDELSVITKDTKINVGGKIKIVTDGVLLRMLAENSISGASIYFDESHQMSSQLELCLSLAKKQEETAQQPLQQQKAGNLFRVMSATIDPHEFLSFLGISKLYTLSGRRYPVALEVEHARDVDDMFRKLSSYLYMQPRGESWIVFLPTRRLVEKYCASYGGVYIHGGLDGSEINKIQARAELDKNLRVFATNVIASSVNIYVDNVLIFNEVIDGKERLGQKTLHYKKIDNNSLLQMIGRVGRFKPGRAVIISDTPIPKKIVATPVRKSLESETPFDLVLLMSKYGLEFSELEFMSKVNHKEVAFADDWLIQIGAIDARTHEITQKGLLMSEIPYDPDFAHMISSALVSGDDEMARFLLACGAFGDSLNHAWKTDMEGVARQLLYGFDKSSELNIKAHLLKRYSEDKEGAFLSRLVGHGVYLGFVEEAWKNYQAAREALNDMLPTIGRAPIPAEVVVNPDVFRLKQYLEDCLSFERFEQYQRNEYNLHDMMIEGQFFARTLTINYKRILFDVVAINSSRRHHHHDHGRHHDR
jgi:HrpA-like RNA helicase